jgi:hypothetical protein
MLDVTTKTYRTRTEAQAAAVYDIGPHAREGFEFTTDKCDGAWRWRRTDTVKALTAAELKIMGGKRAAFAAAVAESGGPGFARFAKNADTEKLRQDTLAKQKEATDAVTADTKFDANGIPTLLSRPNTTEQKAKVTRITQNAIERKIKNPPDAKPAEVAFKDDPEKQAIAAAAKLKTGGKVAKKTGKSKADIIEDMLLNAKGATQEEFKKAVGYNYTNVKDATTRAQKKNSKFKLVEKDGRFWLR